MIFFPEIQKRKKRRYPHRRIFILRCVHKIKYANAEYPRLSTQPICTRGKWRVLRIGVIKNTPVRSTRAYYVRGREWWIFRIGVIKKIRHCAIPEFKYTTYVRAGNRVTSEST